MALDRNECVGYPGMGLGNVIDQFHYEYRLTNTGATKQANLPAT
jgi:hypothetical protein